MNLSPLEAAREARDEAWEQAVSKLAELRTITRGVAGAAPVLASLDGYLVELHHLHRLEASILGSGRAEVPLKPLADS